MSNQQLEDPLVFIAQAMIEFIEGRLVESLNNLKRVIQINPCAPLDIWLAIGIVYFKLKNLPKAKFALEHVVENDPSNAMALTALGVTELQINCSDSKQREKAVVLFQKSFEIDDTNPLTMKHLADHFFFEDELDIAEALCTRALKFCSKIKKPESSDSPSFRKDMVLLSSDLYFILGKVYHKREQFEDALKFYFDSIRHNSQNFAAQFCLAKIHFLNGNFNAVDECLNIILRNPKYKDSFEAIKLLAKVKSL